MKIQRFLAERNKSLKMERLEKAAHDSEKKHAISVLRKSER